MAAGPDVGRPPRHEFAESKGQQTLTVDLPSISSMDGVALDISNTEVRLQLPGGCASRIALPLLAAAAGPPSAKFSKRRAQLTISWLLAPPAPAAEASAAEAGGASAAVAVAVVEAAPALPAASTAASDGEPAAATSAPAPAPTPAPGSVLAAPKASAYGSIWNANSWHWEEKNCVELARAEVRRALESCEKEDLRHVSELEGASITLKDVKVSGEASIALRKGKRILCYELSLSFAWEGRDEFGKALGVKGRGSAKGLTQDGEEAPEVAVEVSASSGRAPEQRTAASWMMRTGAPLLGRRLCASELARAVLAAEEAQADPAGDRALRAQELAKAAAARQHTGEEQARIAAQQREREGADRAAGPAAADTVQGSVWNVNAWHWEERPMTDWSRAWLERELGALTPMQLLDGLAEAELRKLQVSGDASVSVRKGRPIVLFQLSIDCQWEATTYADGMGEACGTLQVPDFSSEEGADSALQIEVRSDASRGRLSSAFRRDCTRKVRAVLANFVEALTNQLPRSGSAS